MNAAAKLTRPLVSLAVFVALAGRLADPVDGLCRPRRSRASRWSPAGRCCSPARSSASPIIGAAAVRRALGRRRRGAQLSRRGAVGDLASRCRRLARLCVGAGARRRASALRSASRSPGRAGHARLVELPVHFLRTLPLLAMVPLFQLWFGATFLRPDRCSSPMASASSSSPAPSTRCATCRRSISTTPAVRRLARRRSIARSSCRRSCRQCARRSLLCLGAGWGAVLGAEYLGAQSGLGYVIVYAQQFAYLDRMFLIALVFILCTSASYLGGAAAVRALARLGAAVARA